MGFTQQASRGKSIYPSVMPEMLPYFLAAFGGLNLLYSAIKSIHETSPSLFGLPAPAAKYCTEGNDSTCSRSDLFAFQIVSGITFLLCGGIGIYSWHITARARRAKSAEARLFGYLVEAKWLTLLNLTYQVWDFCISWQIPEFRTFIMMTHHTVAGIVAFNGLDSQMLGYYSIFYMGLSEVSSIFLVVCDIGQYFPPQPGTYYDVLVNSICAPLFVLSFVYYRVILWWWPISYQLFTDVLTVIQSKRVEQLRPGRTWVLYLLLALDIPMGCLQLYWFALIVQKVHEMIS